jgi:hypothetical protein
MVGILLAAIASYALQRTWDAGPQPQEPISRESESKMSRNIISPPPMEREGPSLDFPCIVFLHIPKVGGRSMRDFLLQIHYKASGWVCKPICYYGKNIPDPRHQSATI